MTSSMPRIKIHVVDPSEHDEEVPLTDVGVVNINGERHLFLIPQSFYSAVRQVASAMPDLPIEQVERMLREHGEFKDFDELLGAPIESAPPVVLPLPPLEPPAAARPRGRAKKWALVAVLVPAFAGSWALGHLTGVGPAVPAASAPDTNPSTASEKAASDKSPGAFTARDFTDFADAGKIVCNPMDTLVAECTDSDGMVMSTKAAVGPDSTVFLFSYGSDRIGLRIFSDAKYAHTWARQKGSRELYPHMKVHGRYVLWGTDAQRIGEYVDLIEEADRAKASGMSTAMGGVEPLPPRLAALTLGTLGLDIQEVHKIIARSMMAAADAPTAIAVRLVLGLDATSTWPEAGADDIVTLAAGIEPPRSPTVSDTPPMAVPVTEPSVTPTGQTTPEEGSTQSMPPTVSPSSTPPLKSTPTTPASPAGPYTQAPTTSTPDSTPPASENPALGEPLPSGPVTPAGPVEETPAPGEPQAPADETPTPAQHTPAPVGEAPAQVETPAEGATPPGQDNNPEEAGPPSQGEKAPSESEDQDDLLILPSSWTVPASF